MKQIAYVFDPIQSEKDKAFVIFVVEAFKEGYYLTLSHKPRPLSLTEIQALASPLDKQVLDFFSYKEKNLFHLPIKQTHEGLKRLAATGNFFFKEKQIVIDVYGSVPLFFHVEEKGGFLHVEKKVRLRDQEIDLCSCDYIGQGPPHWFIKGISLKMIGTDVSWKTLKKESFSREDIEELTEDLDNAVILKNQGLLKKDPLPILILKDKTGAFADLWMDFGNGKKKNFHDPLHQPDQLEKSWERDLLETDFVRKPMDNSSYYCPLNCVTKSLLFLLEIGWTILDWKGNKLLRCTDMELHVKDQDHHFSIRGKVTFENFQADITSVAGVFNRRERFVQLGVDSVGLLPEEWEQKGFDSMLEEAEIVSDALQLKRSSFGTLSDLFASSKVSTDMQLEKLKGFQSISKVSPGKNFTGSLRPYQQDGLNWLGFLVEYGFNGILADDMGLGKTVQVIALLSQAAFHKPVLIVMPTSLIFNWQREILRFLPGRNVVIHHGSERVKSVPEDSTIILTTYATLRIDLPFFQEKEFSAIILDEAQAIKNAHTATAQSVCTLKTDFRLCITGTPIENHLGELWSHFRFLMPELLGDEEAFLADVQTGAVDGRYFQRIKKKVRPFILRRRKEEVAKDLPECIEQIVWVEMGSEQRQVYENMLSGYKGNLLKKVELDGVAKHRMEILEAILRLRQICCHPLLTTSDTDQSSKLEALLADFEVAIEEGRKILVYSQFTTMLQLIAKSVHARGWKHVYLDGSTQNREKVVSQFQDDSAIPLFLISLKAGGVGLNLTAADYVFLYDPWWNNAVEDQAIGRAHRIGRKDTVIAKRYIAIETIEEKILKLKENKKALISDILDDDELNSRALTEEDLKFLLT